METEPNTQTTPDHTDTPDPDRACNSTATGHVLSCPQPCSPIQRKRHATLESVSMFPKTTVPVRHGTSGDNDHLPVVRSATPWPTPSTSPIRHPPTENATDPTTPQVENGRTKKRCGSCRTCVRPHWKKACVTPLTRPNNLHVTNTPPHQERHLTTSADTPTMDQDQSPRGEWNHTPTPKSNSSGTTTIPYPGPLTPQQEIANPSPMTISSISRTPPSTHTTIRQVYVKDLANRSVACTWSRDTSVQDLIQQFAERTSIPWQEIHLGYQSIRKLPMDIMIQDLDPPPGANFWTSLRLRGGMPQVAMENPAEDDGYLSATSTSSMTTTPPPSKTTSHSHRHKQNTLTPHNPTRGRSAHRTIQNTCGYNIARRQTLPLRPLSTSGTTRYTITLSNRSPTPTHEHTTRGLKRIPRPAPTHPTQQPNHTHASPKTPTHHKDHIVNPSIVTNTQRIHRRLRASIITTIACSVIMLLEARLNICRNQDGTYRETNGATSYLHLALILITAMTACLTAHLSTILNNIRQRRDPVAYILIYTRALTAALSCLLLTIIMKCDFVEMQKNQYTAAYMGTAASMAIAIKTIRETRT